MLPALARETGVQGRLLRRSEDATTWMEVYEGVTDCAAFERALAAAVERHDLRQLLAPGTQRHVECFIEA
jgi:DNA-binding transcriptional regulator YdaS (Cro superfamily)